MPYKPGDKVTYKGPLGNERGIVKSVRPDGTIFVVYGAGGDWAHYADYTAAATPAGRLLPGWIEGAR